MDTIQTSGRKVQLLKEDRPRKDLSRTNKTQGEGVRKGSNPVSYKISSPMAPWYNHSTGTNSISAFALAPFVTTFFTPPPCVLFLLSQFLPLSFSSHLGFSHPWCLWLFEYLTSFILTFFASPCLPSRWCNSLSYGLTSSQPLLTLQVLSSLMAGGPRVNHLLSDNTSFAKRKHWKSRRRLINRYVEMSCVSPFSPTDFMVYACHIYKTFVTPLHLWRKFFSVLFISKETTNGSQLYLPFLSGVHFYPGEIPVSLVFHGTWIRI